MANQDRPNQNADTSKAKEEGWASNPNSVRNADRDNSPERLYGPEGGDDAAGITNRPLSEEIGSQESLPARGTTRDQTGNPDTTRPEGDYDEEDR